MSITLLDSEVAKIALNSIPIILVEASPPIPILYINPLLERIFQWDVCPGDLVGKPLNILIPDFAKKVHDEHVMRYAADPRVRPMMLGKEVAGRRFDGSDFPAVVWLSASTVRGTKILCAHVVDLTPILPKQPLKQPPC